MRRLLRGIKHFFLPPPGSSIWLRILPFAVLGVLTVFVLTGSSYAWTYTNSPEFCGSACHTMPPNYSTYLQSPHARVSTAASALDVPSCAWMEWLLSVAPLALVGRTS